MWAGGDHRSFFVCGFFYLIHTIRDGNYRPTLHCSSLYESTTTTTIHFISEHLKLTVNVQTISYGDRVWVWEQVEKMVWRFPVQLSGLASDMTRPATRTLTFLWRQPFFYIRFINGFFSFKGTHCESASRLHYYYIMSFHCYIICSWLCYRPIHYGVQSILSLCAFLIRYTCHTVTQTHTSIHSNGRNTFVVILMYK